MIPHVLHQIWIGPRPAPTAWLDAWRAMHPGWEHLLWDEAAIRSLPLANAAAFDAYLARPHYPGAADVARVEILLSRGGVYTDADSKPVRPFDGAPFMAAGFFAARYATGRVGNGTLGAVAGHPVLADYRESIGQAPRLWPAWNTIGGALLTEVVARHAGDPTVVVLPTGTFYGAGRHGQVVRDGSVPYVRHFWASSPGARRRYQ